MKKLLTLITCIFALNLFATEVPQSAYIKFINNKLQKKGRELL